MLIKDPCVMSRPGSSSLSYLQQIIVKADYSRYRLAGENTKMVPRGVYKFFS